MLGWFKKKFGKKTEEPAAVEAELSPEAVADLASPVPPPEVEPLLPAAADESPELPVSVAEIPEPTEAELAAADATEPAPEEQDIAVTAADEVVEEVAAESIAVPEEPVAEVPEEPAAQAEAILVEAIPKQVAEEPVLPDEPEAMASAAAPGELPEEQEAIAPEAEGPIQEEEEAEPLVAAPTPAEPLRSKTQEKPASKSMFQRLQERLSKTRESLAYRLDRLFLGKKEIDQGLFEELEEILITADLGVGTTMALLDTARKKVKRDQLSDPQALKTIIRDQILAYIEATDQPAELVMPAEGPFVIMVVGVNGVGKTTTIGKIAAKFARAGQSVLMVAGDTFRAAAINQLRIWGERVGVEVIAQKPGADPSSVVYDGLEYGVAHGTDVILIDTAGRLHTSVNLMEELKKIKRVIGKKLPGAPHEIMLVIDATTGQNGIAQAKFFNEAVGVTGLTLTKLDGTAKGGIVANICREIRIPVRFIGIGEQLDDLRDFDAREFVDALFAQQPG